jgi:hypothetical protein
MTLRKLVILSWHLRYSILSSCYNVYNVDSVLLGTKEVHVQTNSSDLSTLLWAQHQVKESNSHLFPLVHVSSTSDCSQHHTLRLLLFCHIVSHLLLLNLCFFPDYSHKQDIWFLVQIVGEYNSRIYFGCSRFSDTVSRNFQCFKI